MLDSIVSLLSQNDRAVERAMLRLESHPALSDYDRSGAAYYATWIKQGKALSGPHLPKARQLAMRYAETLAQLAKDPRVTPEAFVLNREGEFTVRTSGNAHCGTLPIQPIRYFVEGEFAPLLDKRGFLADQIKIDAYFQGIKETSLSCERLCIKALLDVRGILKQDNPNLKIRFLKLGLSPAPFGARMTCKVEGLPPISSGIFGNRCSPPNKPDVIGREQRDCCKRSAPL